MKNYISTVAVLTFIIILSSCSNTKNATALSEETKKNQKEMLYQNEWKLITLHSKNVDTESKVSITFTAGQPDKVSGYTGCNRMTGSFELLNTYGIQFAPIVATKMACVNEKDNEFEKKFTDMFTGITRWYINNENELILFSNGTNIATFTNQKSITAEETKLNGEWELNYISGAKIAFDGLFPNKKPTIIFPFSKEEANGNGSCNGYSIKVKADGNKINFGDALSTMMACEGNGEPVYFRTLKTVTSYNINENILTMIMDDIAVMRFAKK